jgi:hypothetical protein
MAVTEQDQTPQVFRGQGRALRPRGLDRGAVAELRRRRGPGDHGGDPGHLGRPRTGRGPAPEHPPPVDVLPQHARTPRAPARPSPAGGRSRALTGSAPPGRGSAAQGVPGGSPRGVRAPRRRDGPARRGGADLRRGAPVPVESCRPMDGRLRRSTHRVVLRGASTAPRGGGSSAGRDNRHPPRRRGGHRRGGHRRGGHRRGGHRNLGHPLSQWQTAYVVWTALADGAERLCPAASDVARALGGRQTLTSAVGTRDLWCWTATSSAGDDGDLTELAAALDHRDVHVAVDVSARGVEGFNRPPGSPGSPARGTPGPHDPEDRPRPGRRAPLPGHGASGPARGHDPARGRAPARGGRN